MPRRQTAPRPGFTLLELIIVIGIIGILAALGFVAFGAIRGSQEERNTKSTMEIARSMFNAFVANANVGGNSLTRDSAGTDTSYYLRLAPQQWVFNQRAYAENDLPTLVDFRGYQKLNADSTPYNPTLFEYAKTIDYYNVPRRDGDVAVGYMVPMNVPTIVAGDIPTAWLKPPLTNGQQWQLYNTMLTIRRLRGSPEAKAVWSTLRDSQIKHVDAAPPDVPKKDSGDFIMDAWGHPLLFVPGSGIRGLRFGTGPNTETDTSKVPWVKGDPNGSTTPIELQGFRSPDGKAFWMSAGPDGYYDTQDDNLYSFNN